jgi:hypothetical protein
MTRRLIASQIAENEIFPFLQLAGELRNRIYFEVLLADTAIEIRQGLRVPPLLQTCRQVRAEALNLWGVQNSFFVQIVDHDIKLLARFCRIVLAHMDTSPCITYDFVGRSDWANLMGFCKGVFGGELWPVFAGVDASNEAFVVSAATRLAASNAHQSWKKCWEGLEMWRPLAGRLNAEWLDEGKSVP